MSVKNLFYKLIHKRPTLTEVIDYARRYADYSLVNSGESLPPLRIFVNLNNRCNARCVQCDVGLQNEESTFFKTMIQNGDTELSIEKLEELFSELSREKPLICFNGVEPTLYKDLVRAVKSAKARGMETQVTTNGIMLPKLAEELYSAGLDRLWVSLDGPSLVHDEIRGVPGAFDKAMEGLVKLQALKNRNGVKKPSLNVVATIFHRNQSSVCDLLDSLSKSDLEFDEVMIQHLQFVTSSQADAHNKSFPHCTVTAISVEESSPSMVDLKKLKNEIMRVEEKRFPLNVRWKPYLTTEAELEEYYLKPEVFIGNSRCRVFWTELQILADGEVTGSQRCFSLDLGNINKTSFKEIWNGEKMKKWRQFLKGEGALPACSRCCSIL